MLPTARRLFACSLCLATLCADVAWAREENAMALALRGAVGKAEDASPEQMSSSKRPSKGEMILGCLALGPALMAFGARSIWRTKREMKKIQAMYDLDLDAEKLRAMAAEGKLPTVAIVKGVLSAEGANVGAASPLVEGLKDQVGTIDQPENDMIEIARLAKKEPKMKTFTDKVASQTGVRPEDIPDVEDDYSHMQVKVNVGPCVLVEILVARLSVNAYEEKQKKDDGRVVITMHRNARKNSYNVFHSRKVSDGLYLADMSGKKMSLQLPTADTVKTLGLSEPPSLFLSTNDSWSEFTNFLRREGVTSKGQHIDLSQLPKTTLTTPYTMISKFIITDVQSTQELGTVGGNDMVLQQVCEAYSSSSPQLLWEPQSFYDEEETQGSYKQRMMVAPKMFTHMGQTAAEENSRNTAICEPSFSHDQLPRRRDAENCIRYTELAIPRGSPVTVLGRPVKNASGDIELMPPNSAECGRSPDDPDAERFRFRILQGHGVENLLKQRSLNLMQYYSMAVIGAFAAMWGAAGCPGYVQ